MFCIRAQNTTPAIGAFEVMRLAGTVKSIFLLRFNNNENFSRSV